MFLVVVVVGITNFAPISGPDFLGISSWDLGGTCVS